MASSASVIFYFSFSSGATITKLVTRVFMVRRKRKSSAGLSGEGRQKQHEKYKRFNQRGGRGTSGAP